MADSEIITRTNVWVSKKYLTRFYQNEEKPIWVEFCEVLIDDGFEVFVYLPEKITSVYVTFVKNHKMQIARFSDHLPRQENWLKGEVDYYVGPKKLGMLDEQEVLDAVGIYFRS